MQRFKATLSYDGTNFFGWQVQPKDVSIQSSIEDVLKHLSSECVKVHGSGRTDKGVHARGQVAHFELHKPFTERALMRGMNALLPPDIRILKIQKVGLNFHARKSVVRKEYRYFIWNDEVMPPPLRLYRTHVRGSLDLEKMQQMTATLLGEHDFRAFTANNGKEGFDTVRTLFDLKVRQKGHEITIIAIGDGFLYKMVRTIAGLLIKAGRGLETTDAAITILNSKIRTARIPTARPEGLFLWKVKY